MCRGQWPLSFFPEKLCSRYKCEWKYAVAVRISAQAVFRQRIDVFRHSPHLCYTQTRQKSHKADFKQPPFKNGELPDFFPHASKRPARPMWKTAISRRARSPIRNTFLSSEYGHTNPMANSTSACFRAILAPIRDTLSKVWKSCWTPTMTTYTRNSIYECCSNKCQDANCRWSLKKKLCFPWYVSCTNPRFLQNLPICLSSKCEEKASDTNENILSGRALHEYGKTTEIQSKKPVIKMQNDKPKGDQEYTETCKNLRNAPCSPPISMWPSCLDHKIYVKSFPRKSSHDLSKEERKKPQRPQKYPPSGPKVAPNAAAWGTGVVVVPLARKKLASSFLQHATTRLVDIVRAFEWLGTINNK